MRIASSWPWLAFCIIGGLVTQVVLFVGHGDKLLFAAMLLLTLLGGGWLFWKWWTKSRRSHEVSDRGKVRRYD